MTPWPSSIVASTSRAPKLCTVRPSKALTHCMSPILSSGRYCFTHFWSMKHASAPLSIKVRTRIGPSVIMMYALQTSAYNRASVRGRARATAAFLGTGFISVFGFPCFAQHFTSVCPFLLQWEQGGFNEPPSCFFSLVSFDVLGEGNLSRFCPWAVPQRFLNPPDLEELSFALVSSFFFQIAVQHSGILFSILANHPVYTAYYSGGFG